MKPLPSLARLRVFWVHEPLFARANVVLPGLYAWTLTVALPARSPTVSTAARAAAWTAPALLLAGVAVVHRWPRLARLLAIPLFVGLCVASWALAGSAVSVQRLEPVESWLGGLGWVLFALGWGTAREPGRIPEEDPRVLSGPPLNSRGTLPPGARAVLFGATLAALVPLGFAWISHGPAHALLAQAVALLAALLLVHAASLIAIERGRPRVVMGPPARLRAASSPLMLLGSVLLFGLVWAFLR